jgi:photosystem II stability/assembly factor-like uncharacterized protein
LAARRLVQGWLDSVSAGLGRVLLVLLLLCLGAILVLATWRLFSRTQGPSLVKWQQTGGPTGGKVNVLCVSRQNPSVLYAGTDGGIYGSLDGGETWQVKHEGQPVQAMVLDPMDQGVVYMGTRSGVFRSVDSGVTWAQTTVGLTHRMVYSLAIDPTNSSVLFAGTDGLVFKSSDSANTWSVSSEGLRDSTVWCLAVDPATPNTVYAGTESGVFKSTDGGRRWQDASMTSTQRILALAIDPQFPSILFAATEGGAYRTADATVTWERIGSEIGDGIVNALVVDPNNTSILYAGVGPDGVWKSIDGGDTWESITANLHELVLSLAINPLNSRVIYAGTGRGVHCTSTASPNWQSRNEGLVSTNVLALSAVPQHPGQLYASTALDVYRTTDAGKSWSVVDWGMVSPSVLALAVDPLATNTIYAGTWYSEIYRTNDGGRSWYLVNGGLTRDAPVETLLVVRPGQVRDAQLRGSLYAGTNGAGVFVSSDGGIRWKAINSGLGDLRVQVLAAVPRGGDVLYAGTNTGIYRLELDGGEVASPRWQPAQEGLPPDEVRSIVVDTRSPNVVYAATVIGPGEIYRSTDSGHSWTALGRGSLPTNVKVETLAFHSPDGERGILYAGTDGGAFRSTDGGLNWVVVNDGLPARANVLSLAVDDSPRLYASVQNSGVYTSVDRPSSVIPRSIPLLMSGAFLALTLLAGRVIIHSSEQIQDQILERSWPMWDEQILRALQARNQVDLDALPNIPARLRLRALQRYVRDHGEDDLILRANPPLLRPANPLQVWGFVRNWDTARRRVSNATAFQPVVSRLAQQLCQLLGFNLLDTRSYKNLHAYVIKAPALRLKMPSMFPLVFLQSPTVSAHDMRNLYDLMSILNVPSYLALLIVPEGRRATDQERALVRGQSMRLKRGIAHDFIIMGFDDLYRIFVAKDPGRAFIRLLLEQVDLTVVSPYVTSGPVPENMFFGRDYELKTITRTIRDKNFAIVGGRKIGKTSILTNLYRTFADSPDYHALYLDCQAVQNYRDFCDATETMWRVVWSDGSPDKWMQLVESIRQEQEGRLVVFLFDEVDALLKHDIANQERLLKGFRAGAQEGCCRFVLCGGRILDACLHDPDSALFNFCHIIQLAYLSARDTGRIVLEPMQAMGIGFEDAGKLMQRIVDLSACHPNLVQYICQQLIVRLNARGDRLITLADLEDIANSTEFSEYFVEVMWGNATALERLITLLMLDRPSITLSQIGTALREHGVEVSLSVLGQALDGLVLCSILNKVGQEYSFAAPGFPSILTVTQDVEALLQQTMQNLRHEIPGAFRGDLSIGE